MSYFSRMIGKGKNFDAVRYDEDELLNAIIEDNGACCVYGKIQEFF